MNCDITFCNRECANKTCSISELAVNGTARPKNCKFTVTVDEIELTDAIEIIPCTQRAEKSIKGVEIWHY